MGARVSPKDTYKHVCVAAWIVTARNETARCPSIGKYIRGGLIRIPVTTRQTFCRSVGESSSHLVEWKKPETNWYLLYASSYGKFKADLWRRVLHSGDLET